MLRHAVRLANFSLLGLKAIGPIQGKTKADIKQDLSNRGFSPAPSKDGTGEGLDQTHVGRNHGGGPAG